MKSKLHLAPFRLKKFKAIQDSGIIKFFVLSLFLLATTARAKAVLLSPCLEELWTEHKNSLFSWQRVGQHQLKAVDTKEKISLGREKMVVFKKNACN